MIEKAGPPAAFILSCCFAYSLQVARTALGFAVFGVMAPALGFVAPLVAQIRFRDASDRELTAEAAEGVESGVMDRRVTRVEGRP